MNFGILFRMFKCFFFFFKYVCYNLKIVIRVKVSFNTVVNNNNEKLCLILVLYSFLVLFFTQIKYINFFMYHNLDN